MKSKTGEGDTKNLYLYPDAKLFGIWHGKNGEYYDEADLVELKRQGYQIYISTKKFQEVH